MLQVVAQARPSAFPHVVLLFLCCVSSREQAAIDDGSLFGRVKRYADMGALLGAGSPAGSDTDVSALGVVQGHAYSMFQVVEVGDVRLVQVKRERERGCRWLCVTLCVCASVCVSV